MVYSEHRIPRIVRIDVKRRGAQKSFKEVPFVEQINQSTAKSYLYVTWL